MKRIADSSGFTLIEVMIAILVIVVGLLGVAGVATMVINGEHLGQRDDRLPRHWPRTK